MRASPVARAVDIALCPYGACDPSPARCMIPRTSTVEHGTETRIPAKGKGGTNPHARRGARCRRENIAPTPCFPARTASPFRIQFSADLPPPPGDGMVRSGLAGWFPLVRAPADNFRFQGSLRDAACVHCHCSQTGARARRRHGHPPPTAAAPSVDEAAGDTPPSPRAEYSNSGCA
eukprot:gene10728-biopygen265